MSSKGPHIKNKPLVTNKVAEPSLNLFKVIAGTISAKNDQSIEHTQTSDNQYANLLANPYPFYANLRTNDPIHWNPARQAWVVSKYEYIVTIERSGAISYGQRYRDAFKDISANQCAKVPQLRHLFSMHLGHLDGDQHQLYHRVFEQLMDAKAIAKMEPVIQQLVDNKIQKVLAYSEFDLIKDFATPLPIEIMCAYLGIDTQSISDIEPMIIEMLGNLDLSEGNQNELAKKERAVTGLMVFFERMLKQSQVNPTKAMISVLSKDLDGSQDKLERAISACIQCLTGSYESIRHAIGLSFISLLDDHESAIVALTQKGVKEANRAVDELLRYESMVQRLTRTASEDIYIGGKMIKAGQRIFLLPGSGNHDPCQFSDPGQLNLSRTSNRHLSFGYGKHYCPGSKIAKLSIRIALSSLLKELPRLQISASEAQWGEDERQRNLVKLPILVNSTAMSVN